MFMKLSLSTYRLYTKQDSDTVVRCIVRYIHAGRVTPPLVRPRTLSACIDRRGASLRAARPRRVDSAPNPAPVTEGPGYTRDDQTTKLAAQRGLCDCSHRHNDP